LEQKNSSRDEFDAEELQSGWWRNVGNFTRLKKFLNRTVELLEQEAYEAPPWLIQGCRLLPDCPALTFCLDVCRHKWPSQQQIHILCTVAAPRNSRRILFRWRDIHGFPDLGNLKSQSPSCSRQPRTAVEDHTDSRLRSAILKSKL
jgi:hypothetical protein